jgi:hypothetical protein
MRKRALLLCVLAVLAPSFSPELRKPAHNFFRSNEGTQSALTPPPLVRTPRATSAVTLVTAWFPLGAASKHSSDEYVAWMRAFLGSVETPVVVYTTDEGRSEILAIRDSRLPTHFEVRDDVFALPLFAGAAPATRVAAALEAYVGSQPQLDEDRAIHSPALYAVWNAKTAMVSEAIARNEFASRFFFWVDAGSFREPLTTVEMAKKDSHAGMVISDSYQAGHAPRTDNILTNATFRWPDEQRLLRVLGPTPCRILVQLAAPLPPPTVSPDAPLRSLLISATFFGGALPAWRWWHREYYQLHDEWLERGLFVGNDQSNMNSLALRNLGRMIFMGTYALPDACGQLMWTTHFHFQRWLAAAPQRFGVSGALVKTWTSVSSFRLTRALRTLPSPDRFRVPKQLKEIGGCAPTGI